jgi:hypothetical protein
VCRRRFQVLTTPITRASHPSHILNFVGGFAATSPSLRSPYLCLSLGDVSSEAVLRTVWDLVGDRLRSAARDAARLFLILLSFAVHGHHDKGPRPCIGTTAGTTSDVNFRMAVTSHRARELPHAT